jgi:hypothetical protein
LSRLGVLRITVQPDKLTPIDVDNFEIEKFKRAEIDAVLSGNDGAEYPLTIRLDIRANIVSVFPTNEHIHAGFTLLAVVLTWASTYGDHSKFTVSYPIEKSKSDCRISVSNPELFLGFLHHVKQSEGIDLITSGPLIVD